ncbi:hypothetical protein PENPOL_c007G08632 [Penicillium polonicum]|uniref:Dolichol-phosphate mannosyltransferase subunit 3 n=1 Tax=Penicillium polonicum TaxID=60169 RepID=A0A1V6NIB7_PENPO|nr:hypothetical protein PENPOL_c007G08632 [Penicillium polonicum]
MTRAVQTLSVLLLVSSVCYEVPPSQEHNPAWLLLTIDQLYLSLFLGLVPLNETVQTEVIPVLPFYALIVFACYLLARLGVAIFTFNDVPEAHAELQKEIELAKVELRQGKVEVD